MVDSSVLIDHTRGRPDAEELLETRLRRGDDVWSMTVVRTEIIAGARPEEGPSVASVLSSLQWLDVDPDVADLAGRMARHVRPAYPGIDLVDYLIAAGTTLLGAQLLTLNVRRFPMFPDLRRAYSAS